MDERKGLAEKEKMMKLTLGFSPCPNDTFIFDALVNNKIDTGDLQFEVVLEDVQTLNEWALEGRLDVTKISYGVLPLVVNDYLLLDAGGALGRGVGPLLITKSHRNAAEINSLRIGIPGINTTAHVLFSLAFPQAKKKHFIIFSEIENSVLNQQVDAGVIIHENRFTYQKKELFKIMDLGEYWEKETGLPIPLGGIVVNRKFSGTSKQINNLIRQSIEYAFSNYPTMPPYVIEHSQEMDESVMRQHIDMYVNNYSADLGADGKQAVKKFLEVYSQLSGESFDFTSVFPDNE